MSARRLDGKSALITGGSRGIGRAIVDRFVAEGARVMTCGRGKRPDDLAEEASWTTADISDSLDVNKLCTATLDAFGSIDILINNSGVQIEKTLPGTTDEDWD
ncbi:MAG: SDR family oxidoreductase, partial [Rhizobiales bacterium]|nr:SDR family oxidoreductase [Hyphomicrobiales bacterium]